MEEARKNIPLGLWGGMQSCWELDFRLMAFKTNLNASFYSKSLFKCPPTGRKKALGLIIKFILTFTAYPSLLII